jgi:hypothetical protein
VKGAVALIGNSRESKDGSQYDRHFVVQMLRTGHIEVTFSGYEPVARKFFKGKIKSRIPFDDDLWHQVRVLRNGVAETVVLFVDDKEEGTVSMPTRIDLDGQEQRVVIGGGNDRQFRKCQIDELRIWSKVRQEDGIEDCTPKDPHLVAHFTFDDDSDGVRLRDCSATRGDAIRVGSTLQKASAFVEGVPLIKPCDACVGLTWSKLHAGTVVLTYLGLPCDGKRADQFVPGNMYQLEAYLGAMWLDANRLGIPMVIVTECVPDFVIASYTTPAVTFVKLESLTFKPPARCRGTTSAVIKRFFVFHHLFQTNYFAKYHHVVHIDLRDSRIIRAPTWDTKYSLWVQTILASGNVCGGFQAGETAVMASLMAEFLKQADSARCNIGNDQVLLGKIIGSVNKGWRFAPGKIQHDADVVNRQWNRIFDGQTAFVHGDWWMSKNRINEPDAKKAYPRAIPYYATDIVLDKIATLSTIGVDAGRRARTGDAFTLLKTNAWCKNSGAKTLDSGRSIEQCAAIVAANAVCGEQFFAREGICVCLLAGDVCDVDTSANGNGIYKIDESPSQSTIGVDAGRRARTVEGFTLLKTNAWCKNASAKTLDSAGSIKECAAIVAANAVCGKQFFAREGICVCLLAGDVCDVDTSAKGNSLYKISFGP